MDVFAADPLTAPPDDEQPRARRRRARTILPALTVVLSSAAGWAGGSLAADNGDPSPSGALTVERASVALDGQALDVAGVVARVQASVVSIETTVASRRGPFVTRGEGAGTGLVIDGDGRILTNAHVVEDASTITVTAPGDSEPREATLVASDANSDIAVLRVEDSAGLVAAPLAEPGSTAVGDSVVAIGNALALEGGPTVTQGIVSALDRSIETEDGTLTGLLQTDAAISSGNSGGPLVNAAGQVVGINTAVAASGGGVAASNIGFAISIDTAMSVVDELLGGELT